jgi:CHAT domain-containing protein
MINKIVLSILVLAMFHGNVLRSQSNLKYERYIKLSEKYFDAQNFDSSLHYNYVLAHYSTQKKDTSVIVSAWYNIAIINLLQKRFPQANAAQIIANKFITDNVTYREFKLIYNRILNFKSEPLNLQGLNFCHLHKLFYLPLLSKAELDCHNNQLIDAKENLRKLILNMKENGDTSWFGYARANMLMGECFYAIDSNLSAIDYYQTAINIYESNLIFNADLITTYRHFFYVLRATGQSEKRDKYYQTKIENGILINRNRAGYYFIKGDFMRLVLEKEALGAYLQAYNSLNADAEFKNDLVNRIINCYRHTGEKDKASFWLEKLDTKDMNDYDIARIAYNCAELSKIEKGYALIKNIELKKQWYSAGVLYWLGKFYVQTKDFSKAEFYYKRYISNLLAKYKNNHLNLMDGYSDLGYLYWYSKTDYKKSLEYYHKAVFEIIRRHAPINFYNLPDISQSISDKDLARELENKGECFFAVANMRKTKAEVIRDLQASLANLDLAMTVAHRYKMSLSWDEQRFLYADAIRYWYPYIINVCLELYRKTSDKIYANKAFEYAEKSKASMLLSTMRGVNARNMHLLPENVKNEEDRIWTQTELISQNLSESYNSPNTNQKRIDQYNSQLNILRSQQDSLLHIFKHDYPAYYNAKYNAEVMNADSLRKLLNPNEAMLEYSISKDKISIYLLIRNDFKIFTDTIGKDFYADVEAYRKQLSDFTYDFRDSVIRSYAALANRLYNHLIKPAEPYIKGKKLLIIPDDVLTQVPFETLAKTQLPTDKPASFKAIAYLVKEHAVYYNYSGTLYAMNRETLHVNKAKLLAVAPNYKHMKLSMLSAKDTMDIQRDSAELSSIPGATNEVKEIYKIFGGKTLMRSRANKERFKEIAGQYDILHLAAHGIVNNEYPMFSKLVFSKSNDSVNDGCLNTYEIYNMKINAPLVVLSACNTGYGRMHKGEGIISLARGFFTAGAKSIVMTLWAVSDKSSSKLIRNFYSNLGVNRNIGDAMQGAKLKYLEQTDEIGAHPYYWSGYIILGNAASTFEPNPHYSFYFWWGIAVFGFLMVAVIVFRKRLRLITFSYSRNHGILGKL